MRPEIVLIGGQHHQARHVNVDDDVILVLHYDVQGGLVQDVHQQGRQVGHHHDAQQSSCQEH